MDRAVRFSLVALGIFIGTALVILVSKSIDDGEDPGDHEFRLLGEQYARLRAEQTAPRDLDESEIEDRVRERGKRRAALITAAAEREAVDPDWAPATEQQIAERFAAKAPADFELISAICKTSLCIAEVATPSRDASTGQMGWHRFFGLSRAYVHHRGEAGDGFRTVVFLARDGHVLPK